MYRAGILARSIFVKAYIFFRVMGQVAVMYVDKRSINIY
jgi:hypothetical protein